MVYFFLFFLGSALTSFFTLIGMRAPHGESINGRSYCDQCEMPVPWYGLIPVFGYFILKGKCKHCKQKINPLYPAIEFLVGLLFALSYLYLQDNVIEYVIVSVFYALMIIVSVSDLHYRIVPDKILLVFLPALLISRIFFPLTLWYYSVLGGVFGFLFMWFMAWYGKKRFKQEALGGGDIKLYFLIGVFLEIHLVFLSLFFASLVGLIFGKFIMKKTNYIPFVPFIFAGSLMAYFIGPYLLNWYLGLLT